MIPFCEAKFIKIHLMKLCLNESKGESLGQVIRNGLNSEDVKFWLLEMTLLDDAKLRVFE